MTTVTFAGKDRMDVYEMETIYPSLKYALEETILAGAKRFLLGGCSDFDKLAAIALRMLKRNYPYIQSVLVFPHKNLRYIEDFYDASEFPELEPSTEERYAEVKRNWYMLSKSDCLIVYKGVDPRINDVGTRLAKYASKHYPNMKIKKLRNYFLE